MAREGERNKLYEVLDAMQTDREGLISYKEFKTFAQEAENDSRCFSLSFISSSLMLGLHTFHQESEAGQVL